MSENRNYEPQEGSEFIPLESDLVNAEIEAGSHAATPPESPEPRPTASAEEGRCRCFICGQSVDDLVELDDVGNSSSLPDDPGEENDNLLVVNGPSDHQQSSPSVEINVSISFAPSGGSPVTIGISGTQLTPNQAPVSFNFLNRNSTNVLVQIQPNGSGAVPAQTTRSNGEFLPSNCESVVRCPICFRSADNPRATSCGHVFCDGCIHRALSIRSICPVCGVPQEYSNTLQIFP
ncbi:uncharacterized protein [Drosophila takahashii]|uniref:uncharacterized protein isoform X1 n=1 Tax=Drosophila takahashii TaxID=29030 RepID=UPI001CF7FB2C|nr:uncharacterized protein LOC108065033 [Drosophila takahashii]